MYVCPCHSVILVIFTVFCSTELRTETEKLDKAREPRAKAHTLTRKAGVLPLWGHWPLGLTLVTLHLEHLGTSWLFTETENISRFQNSNPGELCVSGGHPFFSVLKVILGVDGAHLEAEKRS